MDYIVGYTADERGRDAVSLAVALARRQDATLQLVMVMPEHSPFNAVYPPERGFESILSAQLQEWLAEGLAMIPDDVTARAHVISADSQAGGLIDAAVDSGASLIIIGASSRGLRKRFNVGSVAGTLLHASPVPVALAPQGYRRLDPITRLTCAVGTRVGADEVIAVAVDSAARRKLPLRLVSLVALDPSSGADGADTAAVEAAHEHANTRLAQAAASLAAGGQVSVEVVSGSTVEEAIGALAWDEGEILLVGSSRLAQHSRLFLGVTANKILRALTVPMVVVPRDYRSDDNQSLQPERSVTKRSDAGEGRDVQPTEVSQ
ncbi:nucleotide-binding universal stress UspA family protein [Arthrobacter sp. CAN_A212]|uniref:universal stress protein n=1 Tax=Arthrobacter sp. CAN_A212 TaxID=2787719 RepID=UPI0018CAA84C